MSYNHPWRHSCGHPATSLQPFASIVENISTTSPLPSLIIPTPCPFCPHFAVGQQVPSLWSDEVEDVLFNFDAEHEVEDVLFDFDAEISNKADGEDGDEGDSVAGNDGSVEGDDGSRLEMDRYRGSSARGSMPMVAVEEDVAPPWGNGGAEENHNHNPFSGAEQFGVDCELPPSIPSERVVEGKKQAYLVPILVAGGKARMFVDLNQFFESDLPQPVEVGDDGAKGPLIVGRRVCGRPASEGGSVFTVSDAALADEANRAETSVSLTDMPGTEGSVRSFDSGSASRLGYDAGDRNPYWDFLWRRYGNQDEVRGGPATWTWVDI